PSILLVMIGVFQFGFTKQQLRTMSSMVEKDHHDPSLTASERQRFVQQLERQEENKAAIRHIKQELKQLDFAEAQYSEAIHLQIQKEKQVQAHIDEERETYPFLQNLEVAHWIELLHIIRQLQQVDRKMEEQQKEIEQLTLQNEAVVKKLDAFAKGDSFKALQAWLDKQYSLKQFQDQYHQEMKELVDKKQIVEEQLEQLTQNIQELFQVAGVMNEDDYYDKANLLTNNADLNQREIEIGRAHV